MIDPQSPGRIKFGLINPMAKTRQKYWIGGYAILAATSLIFYFLIELDVFDLIEKYRPFLRKLSITAFFVFLIFLIGKFIERLIVNHNPSSGHSYNLVRITRLLAGALSATVILSYLYGNWTTTLVSFGLLSLILGFALQSPITSFIAWLYIIFRTPYRVGDRIELNGFKGDVLEISYLDTTLLEFSGSYLTNDRHSGRIVRFPNSIILRSEVFNYSGFNDPFIWNETAVQISYGSDLQFVEHCLLEAAREDYISQYSDFAPLTGEFEPAVYFRVSVYAWVEAVVSYPVLPVETTPRRTRILKKSLDLLNREPQKVQFPEGTSR